MAGRLRRCCGADLVGWVERSETHHSRTPQLMGIASLHPSCGLRALRMWARTFGLGAGGKELGDECSAPTKGQNSFRSSPAREHSSASSAALNTSVSSP
jgi:hypothetical protein